MKKIGDFVAFTFLDHWAKLKTRPAVVVAVSDEGKLNLTVFTDGPNDFLGHHPGHTGIWMVKGIEFGAGANHYTELSTHNETASKLKKVEKPAQKKAICGVCQTEVKATSTVKGHSRLEPCGHPMENYRQVSIEPTPVEPKHISEILPDAIKAVQTRPHMSLRLEGFLAEHGLQALDISHDERRELDLLVEFSLNPSDAQNANMFPKPQMLADALAHHALQNFRDGRWGPEGLKVFDLALSKLCKGMGLQWPENLPRLLEVPRFENEDSNNPEERLAFHKNFFSSMLDSAGDGISADKAKFLRPMYAPVEDALLIRAISNNPNMAKVFEDKITREARAFAQNSIDKMLLELAILLDEKMLTVEEHRKVCAFLKDLIEGSGFEWSDATNAIDTPTTDTPNTTGGSVGTYTGSPLTTEKPEGQS